MQTLRDWVLSLRDRLVSSLEFQRRVAALPFAKLIARNQAQQAFDLCAGFVYSQILLACTELGVFAAVRDEPQTIGAIAFRTGLTENTARQLLDAATSLRLLSRRSRGRYGLGLLGAAIAGNPGLIAMIKHHRMFYDDLSDPVALLKGEKSNSQLNEFWAYARGNGRGLIDADVAQYSLLMSQSQSLVADQMLDAYPLIRHKTLLDIGGGDGEFIIRAAARYPKMSFINFDLPAVSSRAAERFRAAGLERAVSQGGSFLSSNLPDGADVATLIRILHDHDDRHVGPILQAAHRALAPGGVLLIGEPLAGTPGSEAVGDAYFALYFMAMGSGRPRTFGEMRTLVLEAGFTSVREIPTHMPMQLRLLVAQH